MAWRAEILKQYLTIFKIGLSLRQRAFYLCAGQFITVFGIWIIESYKTNRYSTLRWFLCRLAILKVRVGLIGIIRNMLIHIGGVFPSGASFIFARCNYNRSGNNNCRKTQYLYFIHS